MTFTLTISDGLLKTLHLPTFEQLLADFSPLDPKIMTALQQFLHDTDPQHHPPPSESNLLATTPPVAAKEIKLGVFAEHTDSAGINVVSSFAGDLVHRLLRSPGEIYRLTADQFEELIMDRLAAMRYEVKQVSKTTRPDGGIDIIFQSKYGTPGQPIRGAVQVKHHRRPELNSGIEVVNAMTGVLQRHFGQFNMGMVVTNTAFSRDAEWFVRKQLFLRLRDGRDVRRWIEGDFTSEMERREFPPSIQLRSNLMVDLTEGQWQ